MVAAPPESGSILINSPLVNVAEYNRPLASDTRALAAETPSPDPTSSPWPVCASIFSNWLPFTPKSLPSGRKAISKTSTKLVSPTTWELPVAASILSNVLEPSSAPLSTPKSQDLLELVPEQVEVVRVARFEIGETLPTPS